MAFLTLNFCSLMLIIGRPITRGADLRYAARSFAVPSTLDATFSISVPSNSNASPKLYLVFSDQGPQYIFMDRQLAEMYHRSIDSVKENDKIVVDALSHPHPDGTKCCLDCQIYPCRLLGRSRF